MIWQSWLIVNAMLSLKKVVNMSILRVENLFVEVEGKEILKGVTMEIKSGEIAALLGTNGAGKSTLAFAIMGHPDYKITKGSIYVDYKDITELPPHERAKLGIYLGFQMPPEVEGVRVGTILSRIAEKFDNSPNPEKYLEEVNLPKTLLSRSVNTGFSGGERKRFEVARLLATRPKFAILDEPDSGVDVDSINVIVEQINKLRDMGTGFLLITHYRRILQPVSPDKVYVLHNGKIVREGGCELVRMIEKEGFAKVIGNEAN